MQYQPAENENLEAPSNNHKDTRKTVIYSEYINVFLLWWGKKFLLVAKFNEMS